MEQEPAYDDTRVRECIAKAAGIDIKPRSRDGAFFEIEDVLNKMSYSSRLTPEERAGLVKDR